MDKLGKTMKSVTIKESFTIIDSLLAQIIMKLWRISRMSIVKKGKTAQNFPSYLKG